MNNDSDVPESYDPYVATAIVILIAAIAAADLMLFVHGGRSATISAYLRRVLTTYPAVASAISAAVGALWAHIFFSR